MPYGKSSSKGWRNRKLKPDLTKPFLMVTDSDGGLVYVWDVKTLRYISFYGFWMRASRPIEDHLNGLHRNMWWEYL